MSTKTNQDLYEEEALAYCDASSLASAVAGEDERRMVAHSCAISLKRIADALEHIDELKTEEYHNARR